MKAFDYIKRQLDQDMVEGNMHSCLRDVGRHAGGMIASGALTSTEAYQLGEYCMRLAKNPTLAEQKWTEAIEHGKGESVSWDDNKKGQIDHSRGHALDYDSEINQDDPDAYRIVDKNFLQGEELIEPTDWVQTGQLIKYLDAVFESDEIVGYVTESYFHENAQRHLPKKGVFRYTAGQLTEELQKHPKDIGATIGDWHTDVGAWIRFNPLDGEGIKDENVTRYRHALVESDNLSVDKQYALLKELQLPITALVHSGGKSVHAIVRVDADNLDEYRERVNFLYEVCARNSLTMDTQNRNPSRLSRMPGITRDNKKQWLIDTNIGKPDWNEWKNWIEDLNDDLPEIEALKFVNDEDLAPEVIRGVLRKGHKMLLSGPSKAGKSFSLQQLAVASAHGTEWLGWDVRQGNVLYVNLELDSRSNGNRFMKIHEKQGLDNNSCIDVWNLRGNAVQMDKLAPKIIRRAEKKNYSMIIIDPIYKVLTGDENSAQEMAHFCNQFDKIAVQLGATVVYAHHHSKGAQGQKSSRDRSSGSGVFSRDPDAIIDMIELIIEEPKRKAIIQKWHREALHRAFANSGAWGWEEDISQDDALLPDKLMELAIEKNIKFDPVPVREAIFSAEITTAWRIDGTVREFPTFKHRDVFFKYPLHVIDDSAEPLLVDAMPESSEQKWERGQDRAKKDNKSKKEKADDRFESTFNMVCGDRVELHWQELSEAGAGTLQTIKSRAKGHPKFTYENIEGKGYVKLKLETTEVTK